MRQLILPIVVFGCVSVTYTPLAYAFECPKHVAEANPSSTKLLKTWKGWVIRWIKLRWPWFMRCWMTPRCYLPEQRTITRNPKEHTTTREPSLKPIRLRVTPQLLIFCI